MELLKHSVHRSDLRATLKSYVSESLGSASSNIPCMLKAWTEEFPALWQCLTPVSSRCQKSSNCHTCRAVQGDITTRSWKSCCTVMTWYSVWPCNILLFSGFAKQRKERWDPKVEQFALVNMTGLLRFHLMSPWERRLDWLWNWTPSSIPLCKLATDR